MVLFPSPSPSPLWFALLEGRITGTECKMWYRECANVFQRKSCPTEIMTWGRNKVENLWLVNTEAMDKLTFGSINFLNNPCSNWNTSNYFALMLEPGEFFFLWGRVEKKNNRRYCTMIMTQSLNSPNRRWQKITVVLSATDLKYFSKRCYKSCRCWSQSPNYSSI